jgi:hypothetical protein
MAEIEIVQTDGMILLENCPICAEKLENRGHRVQRAVKMVEIAGKEAFPVYVTLRYVPCSTCGNAFQSPRMEASLLDEYYRSGTYREWVYKAPEGAARGEVYNFRANNVADLVDDHDLNCDTHLDFGGAGGELGRKLFEEFNTTSFNVEVDEIYVKRSEEINGIPVLGELPERGLEFDLVTAFEVIEHLADPLDTVAALWDRTAPEGVIMMTVPNVLTSPSTAMRLPHLTAFTPQGMRKLLEYAGIEVINIKSEGGTIVSWSKKSI